MTFLVDHSGKIFTKRKPTMKDLIANEQVVGVMYKNPKSFFPQSNLLKHETTSSNFQEWCWPTHEVKLQLMDWCGRPFWRRSKVLASIQGPVHMFWEMPYSPFSQNTNCFLKGFTQISHRFKTGPWNMAKRWRNWYQGFMNFISICLNSPVMYIVRVLSKNKQVPFHCLSWKNMYIYIYILYISTIVYHIKKLMVWVVGSCAHPRYRGFADLWGGLRGPSTRNLGVSKNKPVAWGGVNSKKMVAKAKTCLQTHGSKKYKVLLYFTVKQWKEHHMVLVILFSSSICLSYICCCRNCLRSGSDQQRVIGIPNRFGGFVHIIHDFAWEQCGLGCFAGFEA